MPLSKVSQHVFGAAAHALGCRELLGAMAVGGLSMVPWSEDEAGGPGVVLFDKVSDGLCEFVREASQGGYGRVLAVGTCGAAIASLPPIMPAAPPCCPAPTVPAQAACGLQHKIRR